ncbi:hypothetical protein WS57_09435 [Burkholderia pseudomultivorans]|nr:hypothetical protein WS57_09435 [Burkholderia pseudomultivorans]
MGAVNAYEKETGIGGWFAERIQESCNALLKALGSPARFGINGENPIEEPAPAPSPADDQSASPEPCAHDYVRKDRVCIECGEKTAEAPIDDLRQEVLRLCRLFLDDEQGKYNAKSVMTRIFSLAATPAPSPADERAAFDLTDAEWLDVFERVSAGIPNVFGSYMKVRAAFAREAIRLANEARAASANETAAEGATVAWMRADDPRDCISDAKKRDMIEHAGAPGARLAESYSIALGRIGATTAQAAEAVTIPAGWKLVPVDPTPEILMAIWQNERDARRAWERALAAVPQPAQADARVGLTDEQREAVQFVIGWYEQATIASNPYHEHIAALRALLQGAKQ